MHPGHSLPILEGKGFTLRPLQRSDADAVLDLLRQPGVARWWGSYDTEKLEHDFFSASAGMTHLVMVGDEIAGVVQFHEENDPGYRHAGVDITLGDAFQDRGLGTAVLRRLIRYLIEERGHHRITIDPSVRNDRAIHVYRKVGFKPVGVMRKYERDPSGQWSDGLLMDLLAEEFVEP
ncbi:MAG: GCN5-related N-acetyltransferase [Actinobacteria bacterium 66_15]|nr:MAG: GCN5-related N-acetyltransferase [Actinobacteria bacterium 66_15]